MDGLSVGDPLTVGQFRLVGRLGSGGMGRVYLGRSPAGELVAVKTMHPRIAEDPGFRSRFASEVAILRRIGSPGVARMIDADPDAAVPWLAMEYVAAPSLEAVVARCGPIAEASLGVLAWRLAQTCADLHAADVAHRDLKPSNVLLAADRPKLVDFGIARAVDTASVTQAGLVLGPPGFMSPEQALGADPGLASDVFSLAGVLVYAATGRGPFGEASTAVAMLRRVVDEEPELSGVAAWLRSALEPCFAKDPGARPTSRELSDRLAGRGDGSWPPPGTDTFGGETLPAGSRVPGVTRRRMLAAVGLVWAIPPLGLAVYAATHPAPAPAPSSTTPDKSISWEIETDRQVAALLLADNMMYAATPSRLYALDPSTGQRRWEAGLGGGLAESEVSLASDGRNSRLLVGVLGRVIALDPLSGQTQWEHVVDGTGPSRMLPAADGDTVFTAGQGQVRALDPATGEVRWTHPLPDGPTSRPYPAAEVCVLTTASRLIALDAESGRRRWAIPLEPGASPGRVISLVVSDGFAVVPDDTGLTAVDVRSGAVVWRAGLRTHPRPEPQFAQMVAAGNTLAVIADGRVHAFALRTGDKWWAYPVVRGPSLESIATDGVTVFASGSRLLEVYGLDLATGVSRGFQYGSAEILGARDGVFYFAYPRALRALEPSWT
jgi:eukaryotic-like serine/threonine-protein kinase